MIFNSLRASYYVYIIESTLKNKTIHHYYFSNYVRFVMTGPEKIAEAMQTLADIKANIQKKYDDVVVRIDGYLKQIDETIANERNQSKEWVDKKVTDLKKKVQDLTDTITAWMEQKLKDAQAWLDNIKKEIEEFIAELLMSMVTAIAGV